MNRELLEDYEAALTAANNFGAEGNNLAEKVQYLGTLIINLTASVQDVGKIMAKQNATIIGLAEQLSPSGGNGHFRN